MVADWRRTVFSSLESPMRPYAHSKACVMPNRVPVTLRHGVVGALCAAKWCLRALLQWNTSFIWHAMEHTMICHMEVMLKKKLGDKEVHYGSTDCYRGHTTNPEYGSEIGP